MKTNEEEGKDSVRAFIHRGFTEERKNGFLLS
jgi:hypothetical protein